MTEQSDKRLAIVDASNVAHSSEGEQARLENIRLVRDKLLEEGYEPIVIAAFPEVRDRAIRYMIVNREVVFERRTKRR
jgi:hypothetical protein